MFHEVCTIFPLMEGEDYQELVEDIRQNGLLEPIWRDGDGLIIDGRNRYRACIDASVEPVYRTWSGNGSLISFVISLNLKRRHLNESQRAMVGARISTMRQGERTDLEPSASLQKVDRAQAADLVNVSERSVNSAAQVIDHGSPALVEAVDRGNVSVSAAAEIAVLDDDEQEAVLEEGKEAVIEKAKEIRGEKAKKKQAKLTPEEKAAKEAQREEKRRLKEERKEQRERLREAKRLIAEERKRKEDSRQAIRDQNKKLVECTPPSLYVANGQRFQAIVIDPPWDWGDEGDVDQYGRARPIYATMPFEKILELPIADLSVENCHLYLWITNRSLPKGFLLLEKWGFRYITALTWVKPSIGMGNYFRGSTEHVLFGVKGSLRLLRSNAKTHFNAHRGSMHSEKPDEFYSLVESCSPGPWLEMFSRRARNGWIAWGAEVKSH